MKTESRKNLVAALLYIVLAAMIVTVVSIAVVSVANRAKSNMPSEQPTDGTQAPSNAPTEPSTSTVKPEDNTEPTEPQPTEPEDKPTAGEVSDTLPTVYAAPANGYVSKSFEDDLPVWSNTMEDYRTHEGIDVACDAHGEVYACAAGTVESIFEDPLMGHAITVYHGGGLRSISMNLSGNYPEDIAPGAPVAAGQVIGYVGDSALIECAEVSHLHFTMTMDEKPVDPLDFVVYEGALPSSAEWED